MTADYNYRPPCYIVHRLYWNCNGDAYIYFTSNINVNVTSVQGSRDASIKDMQPKYFSQNNIHYFLTAKELINIILYF